MYVMLALFRRSNVIPPRSRSGATLTVIGNKAYLVGGVSNHLHEDIYTFDFVAKQWKEQEYTNEHNQFKQRFAHTAVNFRNSLVVYGGEDKYNAVSK